MINFRGKLPLVRAPGFVPDLTALELCCPRRRLGCPYPLVPLPGEILDNEDRAYLTRVRAVYTAASQQRARADEAFSLAGMRMSLVRVWPHCRWSDALDVISIAPRQPE